MAVLPPVVIGDPTFRSIQTSATTVTIDKPADVRTGDILLFDARSNSSTSPTDFVRAGWTRRGSAFVASNAGARVTGMYTHYVADASAEPATYQFAAGAGATRIGASMRVIRPHPLALPWDGEPTYYVSAGGNTTAGYPVFNAYTVPANSRAFYQGGNELVSTAGAAPSSTPPTGATALSIATSTSDNSQTRSISALSTEVITGTTVSSRSVLFPTYAAAVAYSFAIPGTEEAPVAPSGLPITLQDGTDGRMFYVSGDTTLKTPKSARLLHPGFASVDDLVATTGATIAHRGGSLALPEFSQYAYDQSSLVGHGALEFSCMWAKQNSGDSVALIPFGGGDQYLDRAANLTAGTNLNPQTLTMAAIESTYLNHINKGSNPARPFYRLSDFLAKYAASRVVCVDPKYGVTSNAQIDAMLDICDAGGGPDRIIIKFDAPGSGATNVGVRARARGYKTMNYFGTDTTSLAAEQSNWDLLGVLYNADPSVYTAAKSYGKPVWAAVIPDLAGYSTAIARGADLCMTRDTLGTPPVSAWT